MGNWPPLAKPGNRQMFTNHQQPASIHRPISIDRALCVQRTARRRYKDRNREAAVDFAKGPPAEGKMAGQEMADRFAKYLLG